MKKMILIISTFVFLVGLEKMLPAFESLKENDFVDRLNPHSVHEKQRGYKGKRPISEEPSVAMRLQFSKNSDQLLPEAIVTLKELGKALQNEALKGYIYRIEGHTCDIGEDEYNLELSKRRALSVRSFIVNTFNMPSGQFEVKGFGKSKPEVPNTDEQAREKNRRVVIINTLKLLNMKNTLKNSDDKVAICVKHIRNNQLVDLQDGEILTHNDNYAIEFKSQNNMYVYIYQIDTHGKPSQIFPNTEFSLINNPINAEKNYRIPEKDGEWLYLDNNSGKEYIVVIANSSPLSEAETEKICIKQLASSSVDNNTMITSRKFKVEREETSRGVSGIRKDEPTSASNNPSENFFVWTRYFTHK